MTDRLTTLHVRFGAFLRMRTTCGPITSTSFIIRVGIVVTAVETYSKSASCIRTVIHLARVIIIDGNDYYFHIALLRRVAAINYIMLRAFTHC